MRIGISGWRYPPWRGVFYPPGLPQRAELSHAASRFDTLEINGSFYSLQRPEYYRRWAEQVPPQFRFAVKGSRYITHLTRLGGAEAALPNFLASGLLVLEERLGPLLWQLPPTLRLDRHRFADFLARLPRTTAAAAELAVRHDHRLDGRAHTTVETDRPLLHAVEVRHEDYRTPEVAELLREHGVALVVADTAGRWPLLTEVTAGHVYVRLHGDTELYVSGYDDAALDRWARRIREWADRGLDVWVYFDNDVKVRAPFDALALAARLGVGPDPTATQR